MTKKSPLKFDTDKLKGIIEEAVRPSPFCATECAIGEYKGHMIFIKITRDEDDTDGEKVYKHNRCITA